MSCPKLRLLGRFLDDNLLVLLLDLDGEQLRSSLLLISLLGA